MQPDEVQNLSEEGYSCPGILIFAGAILGATGQIWIAISFVVFGLAFLCALKIDSMIPEPQSEIEDDLEDEIA